MNSVILLRNKRVRAKEETGAGKEMINDLGRHLRHGEASKRAMKGLC